MRKVIIHVDDDYSWLELVKISLEEELKEKGVDLTSLSHTSTVNAVKEIKAIGVENVSLVISDGNLLGTETAIEVHSAIRHTGYKGKVILFSGDTKKIQEIATRKNLNPSEMFFAQINKDQIRELVNTVIKVLTE